MMASGDCNVYETVDGEGAHLMCSKHGRIGFWTHKQIEALGKQWSRKLQVTSDSHKKTRNK